MEQTPGDKINAVQLDEKNDIYIEIGAGLRLSVGTSGLSAEGIFVGHKNDEYIVTALTSVFGSVEDQPSKGDNLVIRYRYRGQMLEFQTRLLDLVSYPVELMLLEFPRSVRKCELRSQKRINCHISAKIEVEAAGKGKITNGVIKDISKNGCRFILPPSEHADEVFHVNEQIALKCHFPGIVGEQEATGTVKDIENNADQLTVGIQFSDIQWWVPPYS